MTTETNTDFESFASELDISLLIDQLKSCDVANIAGQVSDDNLGELWYIDMIRRLASWDVPGVMSDQARDIIDWYSEHKSDSHRLEYVGVLCSETESNTTWGEKFDHSTAWMYAEGTEVVRYHGIDYTNTYHRLEYTTADRKWAMLITIPFSAEGFNAYLIVNLIPV